MPSGGFIPRWNGSTRVCMQVVVGLGCAGAYLGSLAGWSPRICEECGGVTKEQEGRGTVCHRGSLMGFDSPASLTAQAFPVVQRHLCMLDTSSFFCFICASQLTGQEGCVERSGVMAANGLCLGPCTEECFWASKLVPCSLFLRSLWLSPMFLLAMAGFACRQREEAAALLVSSCMPRPAVHCRIAASDYRPLSPFEPPPAEEAVSR